MNRLLLVLCFLFVANGASAQVTGLDDWTLFIDPGHSQRENMGVEGFSEAESSLRIGLQLREIFLTETDIDTVYISRTNDQQLVDLSQRPALANQLGVDFYYSIHSDAPSATAHATLFLHGGWRQNGETVEKTPNGGKLYGDLLDHQLTTALRSDSRGNYADRTFYQGTPFEHANKFPYLAVNRLSSMASLLSEGSFHTNPQHNMRQMNAEYQRMQARAAYWAFLEYHGIEIPDQRILAGQIFDHDTGRPVNGAVITVDGREYTTDTFESLFHKYTNDPDRQANGFYYFEDVPSLSAVTVSGENYISQTIDVEVAGGEFTFQDFTIVTSLPPQVASSSPADQPEDYRVIDPIVIEFSRRMDRATTEAAISIEPEVEDFTFRWSNGDRQLTITPAEPLEAETEYTLTVAGTAEGEFGDLLDGDGDGEAGGDYEVQFTTSIADVVAPRLIAGYPNPRGRNIDLHPILSFTYDERVDHATVEGKLTLTLSGSSDPIAGSVSVEDVGEQSVIHFYPEEELQPETGYALNIAAGIADIFGNAIENPFNVAFTTGSTSYVTRTVDNFDSNLTSTWWEPAASGSTVGIVPEETGRFGESEIVNRLSGSTESLGIRYAWDPEAASSLIRVHLIGAGPRSVLLQEDDLFRVYVFGDGSGNEIRFSVRDARSGSAPVGAGPWIPVDWIGWRLVSWSPAADGISVWAGEGAFGPPYFMESFQIRSVDGAATSGTIYFDDLHYARSTTVSAPVAGVPDEFSLEQNYPNPFNPSTTIPFTMAKPGPVSIHIYNALGARVGTLVDSDNVAAGRHEVTWDASMMPSGVYFVRMQADSKVFSQKIVLLK